MFTYVRVGSIFILSVKLVSDTIILQNIFESVFIADRITADTFFYQAPMAIRLKVTFSDSKSFKNEITKYVVVFFKK